MISRLKGFPDRVPMENNEVRCRISTKGSVTQLPLSPSYVESIPCQNMPSYFLPFEASFSSYLRFRHRPVCTQWVLPMASAMNVFCVTSQNLPSHLGMPNDSIFGKPRFAVNREPHPRNRGFLRLKTARSSSWKGETLRLFF